MIPMICPNVPCFDIDMVRFIVFVFGHYEVRYYIMIALESVAVLVFPLRTRSHSK